MSMHLRNSRDMMTSEDAGWWVSKTPLEQKLIILSSVLFVLSFCLTISVIVLDNRKPPACPLTTTVAPPANETTTDSNTTPPDTAPPKTEPTTIVSPTPKPEPPDEKKPEKKEKFWADNKTPAEDLTEYFTEEGPSGREV